jgi:preprotein translocase subunit SecF
MALLVSGIVVPELFRLVGSEIGAKDKNPRGRNGAMVALALILIYVGARFVLHADAVAEMDAHAYKGESPRRVGAFADALSIFKWHGVVETQSLMCTVEVATGPGSRFDADAAYCQHKPETSAALEVAERTETAQKFLSVARFPKATVEKNEDGYEVLIRAVQSEGEVETRQRVAARILLDEKLRVTEERLIWSKELGRR